MLDSSKYVHCVKHILDVDVNTQLRANHVHCL